MRNVVVIVAAVLAGCGGAYDTECDGPGGIDCELVGLPICTKVYGDVAPHAFCTMPCAVDEDCGIDGVCAAWAFKVGARRVCVSPAWTQRQD